MDSVIQQLQGDDTLLLMYLVGELREVDRAEVERRLAGDAKLRADLDRLTDADGSFTSAMEALDGATPIRAEVSAAVRRASASIRQWQVRPGPAITPGAERRPASRWRIWVIPSTAAAIVLVVLCISLYSSSRTKSRLAERPGSMYPIYPPGMSAPVSAPSVQLEDSATANLIAMTTPTVGIAGIDPLMDAAGSGMDIDSGRKDDSKISHGEPDEKAIFDIPLDAGK